MSERVFWVAQSLVLGASVLLFVLICASHFRAQDETQAGVARSAAAVGCSFTLSWFGSYSVLCPQQQGGEAAALLGTGVGGTK